MRFSLAEMKLLIQLVILVLSAILGLSSADCDANKACADKSCCSKYGYCGYGTDFCGDGCQRDCDAVEKGPEVPPDAPCNADKACPTKACCSKFGNCGFSPDFCGDGCLKDCDAKPECGEFADEDKKQCPLKVCCSQFGFCGTTEDFCNDKCQSNCEKPATPSCGSDRELINVGYFASWSTERSCNAFAVSNIDPRSYTHLNYAFGTISGGVMVPPSGDEEEKMKKFVALKNMNTNLKLLVSVGGWVFNDPGPTRQEFHDIVSSTESRKKFIDSVREYLSNYGFDGIDIDYEYPTAEDRGGSPEDTENYLQLVKQMREDFGDSFLITIASPASYWYLRHFKIGAMSEHLDWINVMTYDIHGVWDKEIESLGPILKSHTDIREIKDGIDLYLRDGVKPEKLVLGLGYYGRAFTMKDPSCSKVGCEFSDAAKPGPCTKEGGILAWFEIQQIIDDKKLTPVYDEDSESKILTWDDQWVAYDDGESLAKKKEFASSYCMKGLMIWSIDQGLDWTENDNQLQQVGSVSLCQIELDLFESSFQFKSSRDTTDGFNILSINMKDQTNDVSKRSTNNNFCKAGQFIPPALFVVTIMDRLRDRFITGMDRLLTWIRPNDNNNPIQEVFLRNTTNGVQRVEVIEAHIQPHHLRPNDRSSFPTSGNTSTNYMRNNLNAIWGDERGHLVASVLGGPPLWYNMVPQHASVNRNVNSRWIVQDWWHIEHEMRRHVQDGGQVIWRVAMNYPDELTGRPTEFTYEAVFLDANGQPVTGGQRFGPQRNGPPRGGF